MCLLFSVCNKLTFAHVRAFGWPYFSACNGSGFHSHGYETEPPGFGFMAAVAWLLPELELSGTFLRTSIPTNLISEKMAIPHGKKVGVNSV